MKLTKGLNYLVKYGLVIFLISQGNRLCAQVLELQTCYAEAERMSPLKQQEVYIASIREINQVIESNKRLPALEFRGSASYQSDVFSLPFNVPGAEVPAIPKDQYQLSLNLNQKIYDGGVIRASRQLSEAETDVKQRQLEVSLYQVRGIINELYFGIFSLQTSEKIVTSLLTELENQIKRAASGVEHGVLLPSALRSLQKEKLKARQQLDALSFRQEALRKVLSDWVGRKVTKETILVVPQAEPVRSDTDRPESALFASRMDQLQANEALLKAANRPKLMAFANLGYASPNPLNFFETDWDSWYVVGGRVEWRFWDWNINKKQQQVLTLNRKIIQTEQENFQKNLDNQLTRQYAEIELLQRSIKTDRQVLELQEEITSEAERQFQLGTISATDYVTELNNLTRAQLQLDQRRLQAARAKIEYQTISGNKP